jgi:membrane-bound lytic murein transglycosylase MltF
MNKAAAQKHHARRRMNERHGQTLNSQQHADLVRQIHTGQAKFIERQSNRVSVWAVIHAGVEIRVVYDRNTKNIVTVLPSPAWDAWVCS